jgi:hypothetical protein
MNKMYHFDNGSILAILCQMALSSDFWSRRVQIMPKALTMDNPLQAEGAQLGVSGYMYIIGVYVYYK